MVSRLGGPKPRFADLGAVARLPRFGADVAELRAAVASVFSISQESMIEWTRVGVYSRHVVASYLQRNHGPANVAPLPLLILAHVKHALQLRVLRAIGGAVVGSFAQLARPERAPAADDELVIDGGRGYKG